MRIPEALETLVEYGIVEEVLRPLMSGKEAQIYLVRSAGELRVAKIYKDAELRSFRQRSDYTEGRSTRNSRDRRAMAKHSRHGKEQDEAAWRSAEVNAIYRLSAAGVRVPVPHHFVDGVLVMELVCDHEGQPAPRLGDLVYGPEEAQQIFDALLASVVRMLCAGVVHGDLSEFNVLMAADGPVVIDFPQAVDPATNQNARKLLIRDVDNLLRFLGRHVRGARPLPYAQEMWELYQQNLLTPETRLSGRVTASRRPADTAGVLALIGDVEREHRRAGGASPRGPRGPKVEVIVKGRSSAGGGAPPAGQGGRERPGRAEGPSQRGGGEGPRRAAGAEGNAGPRRGERGASEGSGGPRRAEEARTRSTGERGASEGPRRAARERPGQAGGSEGPRRAGADKGNGGPGRAEEARTRSTGERGASEGSAGSGRGEEARTRSTGERGASEGSAGPRRAEEARERGASEARTRSTGERGASEARTRPVNEAARRAEGEAPRRAPGRAEGEGSPASAASRPGEGSPGEDASGRASEDGVSRRRRRRRSRGAPSRERSTTMA